MDWLRRVLAPRNRGFITYVALMAALVAGGQWYKGRLKPPTLKQISSSVRRGVTDRDELIKLKMERSTLQFQLPNLRNRYPVLTNASLARDWQTAMLLGQFDPEVRQGRRDWLRRVAPVVQQAEPDLAAYLALEQGYEMEVAQLAQEVFVPNKTARLMDLRTNKFGLLFTQTNYVADAARFERTAQRVADQTTLALRQAWQLALVAAATNLNPKLCDYGRARLEYELRSDEIRGRVKQLDELLGNVPESPLASASPARENATFAAPGFLSGPSFDTYLPLEKDFIGILLATLVAGLVITTSVELRDRRWLRIGASLVLVYLCLLAMRLPGRLDLTTAAANAVSFFGFLVPAAFLATLWSPVFSFFLSDLFMRLVDSHGLEATEMTLLRPAYRAARQAEFRQALDLIEPKLLAEPRHYETLVLKARLQRHLNRKWRTKWTLAKVLRNPNLTAGQREHAEHMLRNLKDTSQVCWSFEAAIPPTRKSKSGTSGPTAQIRW